MEMREITAVYTSLPLDVIYENFTSIMSVCKQKILLHSMSGYKAYYSQLIRFYKFYNGTTDF